MHRFGVLVALAAVLVAPGARAVSGISVTDHWSGQNANDTFYGGFGEIWRHDLRDNTVVAHRMIYQGPAREPVINWNGTHVAFIKEDGTIAVMSIEGGAETDLVLGHPYGCLEWPEGDWVYYNLGTWGDDTSRFLRRVNAFTGVDEQVVEFECTTWRFGIARDLRRAVVRDTSVQNTIVAYDLQSDNGHMRPERACDVPSCGEAMDALGEYFVDGMIDHSGMDIRRWDDLEIVESFTHLAAQAWGDRDSGEGHNRNGWATNDQKWICAHVGWNLHFSSDSRGSNQVLYNWIDHERIVVTDNEDYSYSYDSAGDFWVDHNEINEPPTVHAGDDRTVQVATPTLLLSSATDDGRIRSPLALAWSLVAGPGNATFGTPYAARTTVVFDAVGSYTVRLSASDGENVASDEAQIAVTDQPVITLLAPAGGERWQAGDSHDIVWEAPGVDDVTLAYSVDDGATWQVIAPSVDTSAPEWGRYPWQVPPTPSLQARVALWAYIGGNGRVVSERFEIVGLPTDISILRPAGGETFEVGAQESLRWTSAELAAVALSYSTDDGASWHPIEYVQRSAADWGDFAWRVPDQPSTNCRIAVADYGNLFKRTVSERFEIRAAPEDDGCGCRAAYGPAAGLAASLAAGALLLLALRRR